MDEKERKSNVKVEREEKRMGGGEKREEKVFLPFVFSHELTN